MGSFLFGNDGVAHILALNGTMGKTFFPAKDDWLP